MEVSNLYNPGLISLILKDNEIRGFLLGTVHKNNFLFFSKFKSLVDKILPHCTCVGVETLKAGEDPTHVVLEGVGSFIDTIDPKQIKKTKELFQQTIDRVFEQELFPTRINLGIIENHIRNNEAAIDCLNGESPSFQEDFKNLENNSRVLEKKRSNYVKEINGLINNKVKLFSSFKSSSNEGLQLLKHLKFVLEGSTNVNDKLFHSMDTYLISEAKKRNLKVVGLDDNLDLSELEIEFRTSTLKMALSWNSVQRIEQEFQCQLEVIDMLNKIWWYQPERMAVIEKEDFFRVALRSLEEASEIDKLLKKGEIVISGLGTKHSKEVINHLQDKGWKIDPLFVKEDGTFISDYFK